MTYIKICGIKEEIHALAATEAGADFIGLIFAPSPRRISLKQAQEIALAVKESDHPTEVVGVFVNSHAATVNMIADSCYLDRVQLSGDESWEYCKEITRPVIKAVRIKPGQSTGEIGKHMAEGDKVLSGGQLVFLLDSDYKGKYGGTGKTLDWNLAKSLAGEYRILLAGGLTPENVGSAIGLVAPWGVDVSSGLEVDGIKQLTRIRSFIKAVRRCNEHSR